MNTDRRPRRRPPPLRLICTLALSTVISLTPCGVVRGQTAPLRQTEADAYTRYELLAPGSAKFRILYDVTATAAGATHYFNPIRTGSIATDEHVIDRSSGQPLSFDVVGAAMARAGGVRVSDSTQQYIRVTLARPVPADGGEARVLIDKTYEDAKSYFMDGTTIVFNRPLGIKRNAVVLPPGYELESCNYPSQILQEADGRMVISFWNTTPAEAPLVLRARANTALRDAPRARSAIASRLSERAVQSREIVYFLQQPETHAFDLYHDYTETRAGVDRYLNVVRAGSRVSNPSARNLDTGAPLTLEVLKGDAITQAKLDIGEPITPLSEVVVFRFAPVESGSSLRVRMSETYTDSARYRLANDELVWDRSFGRPANAVVLPAGWMLTNSAVPATVSTLPDGRIRLDFLNPRSDEIAVVITARRRATPARPPALFGAPRPR